MPGGSQAGTSFLVFIACLLAVLASVSLQGQSVHPLLCSFHGAINTIGEGIFLGKGRKNPLFFLGYILMATHSIYLWYQGISKDKA